MNIFILDKDPRVAAMQHNNKHVVKMIVESAQMLCSAHRLLDGKEVTFPKKMKNGKYRKTKIWKLPDARDAIMYKTTHINHPCAAWCRETVENYMWLYELTVALCDEYYHRYGQHKPTPTHHKTRRDGLLDMLATPPRNIPCGTLTSFPQAMPDQYKDADPVQAYRNYYCGEKAAIMQYIHREVPDWVHRGIFKQNLKHGKKIHAIPTKA